MKILNLTIKKHWCDMIASGEKTEEYREYRVCNINRIIGKNHKAIKFRNGYSKNAPSITVDIIDLVYGKGTPSWGAPPENVFIFRLGHILSKSLATHNSPLATSPKEQA